MSESNPIRIAIVGIGRAGWGMHTKELASRDDTFKIVACCEPIEERRKMMAEKYGCKTYDDFDEMLKDDDVELVDIASPSAFHTPQAILALEAGKIVFLEKPIAVSHDEAKQLMAVAEKHPGKLFIRHNRREEPTFQHIREIISSGILGEVYEIKLRRGGYQRRGDWQTVKEKRGGQLLNWGPHIIDHALRFVDGKVNSVWSDLRRIACLGDAEDHVHIIIKGGDNDRVVDLEISGGAAIKEPTYLVYGTRGALTSDERTIKMKYLDPDVQLADLKADPGTPPVGGSFGSKEQLAWIEKEIDVAPSTKCQGVHIWDHLYETIRNDKPFIIELSEALQVMEIISKAREGTEF